MKKLFSVLLVCLFASSAFAAEAATAPATGSDAPKVVKHTKKKHTVKHTLKKKAASADAAATAK